MTIKPLSELANEISQGDLLLLILAENNGNFVGFVDGLGYSGDEVHKTLNVVYLSSGSKNNTGISIGDIDLDRRKLQHRTFRFGYDVRGYKILQRAKKGEK